RTAPPTKLSPRGLGAGPAPAHSCAVPRRPASGKTTTAPAEGQVIVLSRYRAQVSRGRRARRGEELFATPHPERAIQTLPPDEFFYVLAETGFPDALEILQYGTPEQVQGALDF